MPTTPRSRAARPPAGERGSGPALSPFDHPRGRLDDEDWKRAAGERDKTFEALLIFFDWRHKVMVRFAVLVAAVLAAWFKLDEPRWQLRAGVLALGSAGCFVIQAMDKVNAGHLERLYRQGCRWESFLHTDVGVFGAIRWQAGDRQREAPVEGVVSQGVAADQGRTGRRHFSGRRGRSEGASLAEQPGKRTRSAEDRRDPDRIGERQSYGKLVRRTYGTTAVLLLGGALLTLVERFGPWPG